MADGEMGSEKPKVEKPKLQNFTVTVHEETAGPASGGSQPVHWSIEYDPIANRMVYKKAEIGTHGRNQDTSNATLNQDQSKDNNSSSQQMSSQDEGSLRSEFEQYKARRLPESFADQLNNDTQFPQTRVPTEEQNPPYSLSDAAQRAKLEQSFQKVHSSQAIDGVEELSRPVISTRDGRLEQPVKKISIEPDTESAANARISEYDAVLQNLSARIKDVGQRVDRLQSKPSPNPQAETQPHKNFDFEKQRESEELLREAVQRVPSNHSQGCAASWPKTYRITAASLIPVNCPWMSKSLPLRPNSHLNTSMRSWPMTQ